MGITTKFRGAIGIKDYTIAENPFYCVIHYVKDTVGVPSVAGLEDEYCLNTSEEILYRYNGSSWVNQNIDPTDRFCFCKDGSVANGCGENTADMKIYYYDNKYINKDADDGIIVLLKNESLGYTAKSLLAFDKYANDWVIIETGGSGPSTFETSWVEPVISQSVTSDPASPSNKDRYIIPIGATGNWSGQDNKIAEWNSSHWIYENSHQGLVVFIKDENQIYSYNGSLWESIVDGGTF